MPVSSRAISEFRLSHSLLSISAFSESKILLEKLDQLSFQRIYGDFPVRTECFPLGIVAHSPMLDLVYLSTMVSRNLQKTQRLAPVSTLECAGELETLNGIALTSRSRKTLVKSTVPFLSCRLFQTHLPWSRDR